MNFGDLWTIVQTLVQSLQAATFFPALLITLSFVYWIPILTQPANATLSAQEPNLLTVGLATLTISYTLYAFNYIFIRFLEGYVWKDWKFGPGSKACADMLAKQKRLSKEIMDLKAEQANLDELIAELKNGPAEGLSLDESLLDLQKTETNLRKAEVMLEANYPTNPNAILPTRLGNVIAAFEEYPNSRYGMDSITLWPRLIPVLQESKYLNFLQQERGVFNFLLNTGLACLLVGIKLFFDLMYNGQLLPSVLVFVGTSLVIWICYQGLVESAQDWGATYRVAYDLHRHDLIKRLGLRPPTTFSEELSLWQNVSRFFAFRPAKPGGDFSDFKYSPRAEQSKQRFE